MAGNKNPLVKKKKIKSYKKILVANRQIRKGEKFTTNITCKRPANGSPTL